MDKVQFQLEATLPELKDLYEKGLFTKSEINQITKKRTAFETSLVRRVTRKEDFFKYAEYEINLERLRKVRYKKLNYHLNPPPPSASSFSLPRRALYILKRATAKFPGDLATWLAYVEFASREGMRKVVGKGLNSALQHHPTSSTLYLLQTYYHLHPGSPFPRESIPSTSKLDLPSASSSTNQAPGFAIEGIDPARTTLLLGLRLLPQSRDLWREYVKLELGWVEALRRRWKLLGIKDQNQDAPSQVEGEDVQKDQDALRGGEGAFGEEGEEARKSILAGELVIHALSSALESIPSTCSTTEEEKLDGMGFRENLIQLFRNYPSPLRLKCLNVLYEDLQSVSEQSDNSRMAAKAGLLLLNKGLYDREYNPEDKPSKEGESVLDGVELVEELGKIGKEIRKSIKGKGQNKDWIEVVGLWLIEQIGKLEDKIEVREYLSSILSSLTKPSLLPPSSLLIAHLSYFSSSPNLDIARSYALIYPSNPSIQLYRLTAEVQLSTDATQTCKTCEEVVRAVTKSGLSEEEGEDVRSIWKLWIDKELQNPDGNLEERWKVILRESMKLGVHVRDLHGDVLGYYIINTLKSGEEVNGVLNKIKSYQPTFNTFNLVFTSLQDNNVQPDDLKKIYNAWRGFCKTPYEKAQAALAYAQVLLGIKGKGKEAYDVIEVTKREVRVDEGVEKYLEAGWKMLVDAESEGDSGDEDEEMSDE
ncbi:U3 small nucleolar RNA-associated protein 6 [Kwoniella mangroviensis CBS 8886]|nr:U3 small nucleolar RNA-associated protein 6 [Kwoniella mangroviensis CBS 8886]